MLALSLGHLANSIVKNMENAHCGHANYFVTFSLSNLFAGSVVNALCYDLALTDYFSAFRMEMLPRRNLLNFDIIRKRKLSYCEQKV